MCAANAIVTSDPVGDRTLDKKRGMGAPKWLPEQDSNLRPFD